MKIVKPTKYVIKIKSCGFDTCKAYYKGQYESINAFKLSKSVINLMKNQFVEDEKKPMYDYYFACMLLKSLNFNKEKLFEDIEDINNIIESFNLEQKEKGDRK